MYYTENQTASPHIYEAGNMHEEWQNNFWHLTYRLISSQLHLYKLLGSLIHNKHLISGGCHVFSVVKSLTCNVTSYFSWREAKRTIIPFEM